MKCSLLYIFPYDKGQKREEFFSPGLSHQNKHNTRIECDLFFFFLFFGLRNKHTHTNKREISFNIKTHCNSTKKSKVDGNFAKWRVILEIYS